MEIFIYIVISLIILIPLLLILNNKIFIKLSKKRINRQLQEYANTELQKLLNETRQAADRKKQSLADEISRVEKDLNERVHNAEIRSRAVDIQVDRHIQAQKELLNSKQSNIENDLKSYYVSKLNRFKKDCELAIADVKAGLQTEIDEQMSKNFDELSSLNEELNKVRQELNEYQLKRQALNEELKREKELREKQDFSRIVLQPDSKSDISYITSLVTNLSHKETLYKLIWTEYIQKPFNQMIKNVLGSTDPRNIIYIITNIHTSEVYIGKTKSEASKRWTEHVKTSLNIGTSAKCKLHDSMYGHWDDFAFAVLEKVPLDQDLSEREKYWIDFYQSNIYGYNMKAGG